MVKERREDMTYNPWPVGKLPKEWQRPELEQVKNLGYTWEDPREIITLFENKIAAWAGARYGVAVDCCTHAIELSLRYRMRIGELSIGDRILIPRHTYISVPMTLINMGFRVEFMPWEWKDGYYNLEPTNIIDGAGVFRPGMYVHNSLFCLSFQIKKILPIGRGGMILTNDDLAAEWLKLASYDGRDLNTPYDSTEHVRCLGYHYYMTPEDAARGLILFNDVKPGVATDWSSYPDTQKMLKHV